MTLGWVCHLCTKMNPIDHEGTCLCCGRPRRYATKSLAKKSSTKALILHADLSKHTRPEQVADMIEHGFDVNELSLEGYSVLHCAALHGQASIIHELLQHGANTETEAISGRRALHYATESGSLEAVQELVSHGAFLDAKTLTDELTPLHIAGLKGFYSIAELLLQSGANLVARTKLMNQTALHFAAEAGHLDCVRVLLRYDHRSELIKVVDISGASAIQVAQFGQHEAVSELLLLHSQSDALIHDRMLSSLLLSTPGGLQS
ncbi:hypothetical protein THRCLA_00707 [Thraustotheca clavata]|uniref:Uncharacterized protein n=1 Tax=Thraustotheca clavata TaxID=74557 RepID=A0A1W0AAH5_9STRA|nr:hypothetical protein THRCLA_00707 [Thraustotheca clavata]